MKLIVKLTFFMLLVIGSSRLSAQTDPYTSTLLSLCNALLPSQINDRSNRNFGALVCPSTNPDDHPLHSRAAEAMYPFAIAYKITGKAQYRDAAIKLGNWLITIQERSGARKGGWSENWPDPQQKGWYGTTTDQLISMAGAYPILKRYLSATETQSWNKAMEAAADFIAANFPIGGNINYNPTGAATLLLTYKVADHPKQRWLIKADSLINVNTLNNINADGLLTGEGNGVDGGYNIAQSIGYIALYGILKSDEAIKQKAAALLKVHEKFVYPNGSVDNSWGTRSFKWIYESGTKTAPGVYFSFALLAGMDPGFGSAGLKCLEYLNNSAMRNGWIGYGPHAHRHASTFPACNYSTFARAQSIALAIAYSTKTAVKKPFPAELNHWYQFFPSVKVAVIRRGKMMATISAYGETGRYPRSSVCRGGSITNLWYHGFGKNGFLQSSSSSSYKRIEALHMPIEKDLLPLTPRIEFGSDSAYYSNIFEDAATMSVQEQPDHISVRATGQMRSIEGASLNTKYSLTHRFYDSCLIKEITVEGNVGEYRIVEPIVKDSGTIFRLENDSTVIFTTSSSKQEWELKVISSTIPCKISLGTDATRYWSPFPGVEAYPIILRFSTRADAAEKIQLSIGPRR